MIIPLAILGILAVFLIGEKVCAHFAARRHGKTDPRSCSSTTEGPSPWQRACINENVPEWICDECGASINAQFGGYNSCGCKSSFTERAFTGMWVNPPSRYEGNDVA